MAGDAASVPRAPTALILSIGSELLLGETVDTNAAYLASALADAGLELLGVRQLPDDRAVIADALPAGLREADLVLATGGLGPTHDDLTREGVADAVGERLDEDPTLANALRERFGGAGRMPVSNLRQAMRIPSASVLANPIGSAPGWWVEHQGRVVALMPGVPSEMRRMWTEELLPRLAQDVGLRPLHRRTVKTFGIGESAVAEKVGDLLESPGDGVIAGIYARDDGVHLRFSTRDDPALLDGPMARATMLLGEDVFGIDDQTLPGVALRALADAGVSSLATVEVGTEGALLAILAAHERADGEARFAGGVLGVKASAGATRPGADVVLRVLLGEPGALGRSRVHVTLDAPAIGFAERQLRIHGSGQQRLRRAAFAALDQIRRANRG